MKKTSVIRFLKMFLLLILCSVILYSAYQIFSILSENKKSENAYSELREQVEEQIKQENENQEPGAEEDEKEQGSENQEKEQTERVSSIDIPTLQKSYPELKAWIKAEGIGVDYPVMQSEDNTFYLTHLYDGSENANGSLFLDFRNTGLFAEDNTVIYGHNMKNGAMFGHLTEYKSQEFYENHPTMLLTKEEGDYQLHLICGTVEDGDYEFVKFTFDDFEDMEAYMEELRARSTFESQVKLTPGSKLVSLCTCTYDGQNTRYMLVGYVD